MPLSSGTHLGPYEVTSLLGTGGMGEVYRARDSRLARDVAVKVLPPGHVADPERYQRFRQEARAAGSLNHPNLCTIYDVGTHDGSPYVVMELLTGATLRERLARGAIPARQAAQWAQELAQGLAAAHEHGIVHRDLKPENVFVTKDGRVKILDFGLAKLAPPTAGAAQAETRTDLHTMTGVIVGTPGYMAPEQVRGQAVDHRADLFALGAILYEMLTGQRAFRGDSTIETAHAILHDDPPPPASLPAPAAPGGSGIPVGLSRLTMHCLEKDPERRSQSARDLAFELEEFTGATAEASASGQGPPAAPRAQAGARALRAGAGVLALAVAVLAGAWGGQRLARPQPAQLTRLTFSQGTVTRARFSPDGSRVFYSAAWAGEPNRIFAVDDGSAASSPVGVPDALFLAASRKHELAVLLDPVPMNVFGHFQGTLAVVPVSGGSPRPLLEGVIDADWSPDGAGLAVVHNTAGHIRVEWPIGNPIYESPGFAGSIRVSPDGRHVAFFAYDRSGEDSGILVVAGPDGHARTLTRRISLRGLAWNPRGNEIWFTGVQNGIERRLMAVDLQGRQRLVYRVPGTLILQDIARDGRALILGGSERASVLYRDADTPVDRDLSVWDFPLCADISSRGDAVLIDETGEGSVPRPAIFLRRLDSPAPIRLGDGLGMAFSPDGRWVLAIAPDPPAHLVRLPIGAGSPLPLAPGSIEVFGWGRFTPDGRSVVFAGNERGQPGRLFVQPVDSGAAKPITPPGVSDTNILSSEILTPDGRDVVVLENDSTCALYPLAGGSPRPVRGFRTGELPVRFAADGRSLLVLHQVGVAEFEIEALDPESGRRSPWRSLRLSDPTGVWGLGSMRISDDGRHLAFTVNRCLTTLYMASGLR